MSETTTATSEASRIAQFMGLKRPNTIGEVKLAEMVAAGLPTETLDAVVKRIDPRGRILSVNDFVPRSSLHRMKTQKKTLSKDQSEMVFAMGKLFSETLRLYHGDAQLASMFLSRPHPMLGDESPIAVAKKSTAGVDLVLSVLMRADAGVAA